MTTIKDLWNRFWWVLLLIGVLACIIVMTVRYVRSNSTPAPVPTETPTLMPTLDASIFGSPTPEATIVPTDTPMPTIQSTDMPDQFTSNLLTAEATNGIGVTMVPTNATPAPTTGSSANAGTFDPATAANSCGVTSYNEGEAFKWKVDMTIGGDLTKASGALFNDGGNKLAVVVPAGKSADVQGASMSGRIFQFSGTEQAVTCFMDALISGDPSVTRWLVDSTAIGDWVTTPPTNWTVSINTEAAIPDLVSPAGVTWNDTPLAIDATHTKIGGDDNAYRCEPWQPKKPGYSWDVLIAPHSSVTFDITKWQAQCWAASGVTDANLADVFKLAEQRTYQHEQRMIDAKAFNGMYLLYVGPDKSIMPTSLFVTDLKVKTGSWIFAGDSTPTGWTIK